MPNRHPPFEVRRFLRTYLDTEVLLATDSMKLARRHATRLAGEDPSGTFAVVDSTGAIVLRVPVRPRRTRTVYYDGGLRGIRTEDPDRFGVEMDLGVLSKRFGIPLIANLLRVQAGANRIISLQDFVRLNSLHVSQESVEHERNLLFAALQILGVFRELSLALDDLGRTGIKGRLSDRAPWAELQLVQQRWGAELPSHFRSQVLFHFGFPKEVNAALERKLGKDVRGMFVEGDPDGHHLHSRFTAGEELLLLASEIEVDDLEDIAEESLEDMKVIFRCIDEITRDLVRQCCAGVP